MRTDGMMRAALVKTKDVGAASKLVKSQKALQRSIAERKVQCEVCEQTGGEQCYLCSDMEHRMGLEDLNA